MMSGCRHVMRVWWTAAHIVSYFQLVVHKFVDTSARISTVTAFFNVEIKRVSGVIFISHEQLHFIDQKQVELQNELYVE